MVECITYKMDRESFATIAFDVATHGLRWIEVQHKPTDSVATLDFMAYQTVDGVRVPTQIEMQGRGLGFTDVLTDWTIE
jgi:hypothetical protein